MSKIHPAGTPVKEIKRFDRSTKVYFQCTEHSDYIWCSKEPSVSSWFPGNDAARDLEFRCLPLPCNSRCEYVTSYEYEDADHTW